MNNIGRLFISDVKHLFANVVSTIITIGLIVMPSIFAWYNIIACWNVFDNTGNITVAVANTDEGYKSDLIPIEVNVGDMVVSALRANDQIGWEVTSEEDAVDGAMSGKYYAAVVIPQGFSRDMLTFYSDQSDHADIIYYSNEKKNAISPKVTDTGADTISYEVNKVFAETLSEISLAFAQSISDYADEMGVDGRLADLSNHVSGMADRIDQAASVLGLYSTLMGSAQNLVTDCAGLVDAARQSVNEMRAVGKDGAAASEGLVGAASDASQEMSNALDTAVSTFDDIGASIDATFAVVGTDTANVGSSISGMGSSVGAMSEDYRAIAQDLRSAAARFPEGSPERAALESVAGGAENAASRIEMLSRNLTRASEALESGADRVHDGRTALQEDIRGARQSMQQVKQDFDEKLKPIMDELVEKSASLANTLAGGLANLDSSSASLISSAQSVNDSIGGAASRMNDAVAKMHDSSEKIRDLAQSIGEALAAGDVDKLKEVLGSDTEALSKALSAPVGVERHAIFSSHNFGSAMAPFYTTLAIYIGSLLILVVVKPRPSRRALRKLDNPKPRQLFIGRLGVMLFLSFCQTTLMATGNILFLQVQVAHPWLLVVCFWLAGFVFTSIIYAFVYAFANLGKAIAVILLIIQVTGCGGSYPLQILPDFVQALSPYLPATHVVNAMRAAMFGVFQNDFWIQSLQLLLFLIPAAIVGLVLQKPFSKFMEWYVKTVESTKVVS